MREYRFFSTFSYILYTAIGLLFVDCTYDLTGELDFKGKSIYSFYPTHFYKSRKFNETGNTRHKWKTQNNYKMEYRNFLKSIKDNLSTDNIVLNLDISSYFESVSHEKLISLLSKFSPESNLKYHNYVDDSGAILEFYFESLMKQKHSIPQGRKNLVSDYFGYLYLIPFDIEISSLVRNNALSFKCLIRYVDDIYIIFEKNSRKISSNDVLKELLSIEGRINSWLYRKLGLLISNSKTVRKIITDDSCKREFLEITKKAISSSEVQDDSNVSKAPREKLLEYYLSALERFRLAGDKNLNFIIPRENKEDLKIIFDRNFQKYLFKPAVKNRVKRALKAFEFELMSDCINILIVLFYLKNKKNETPYLSDFINFLKSIKDLSDKRFIHILLMAVSSKERFPAFEKLINKNHDILKQDDYGKYLALIYRHRIEEDFSGYSSIAVYNRIADEFLNKKLPRASFIFNKKDVFCTTIQSIIAQYPDNALLINSLKNFIYYYRSKKWDQAFTFFHSLFYELCRSSCRLAGSPDIDIISRRIKDLSISEEITLRKFYKRKRYTENPSASHKPALSFSISRSELDSYISSILPIMGKIPGR